MDKQKTEDTKQGLFVHVGGNGGMDMRLARLNAAAPDLYDALFELISSDENVRDSTNAELTTMASDPMQPDALRRLASAILRGRAAIAKATGSPL